MTKGIIIVVFIFLIVGNITHFSLNNQKKNLENVELFSKTIGLPGVVKSVGFYENRFIEYKDNSKNYYPTLPNISYMKFVYEK